MNMGNLSHWQGFSVGAIVLVSLACSCQQRTTQKLSHGDNVLMGGCSVRLYQDKISKEAGDYVVYGIASDVDHNGKERVRAVRSGRSVSEVLEKLAVDVLNFDMASETTPHQKDGRWEVAKRWPKPYPFVLWVWTWPGRTNEPTVYVESPESRPPKNPPDVLPTGPDDFQPGTKNNL